VDDVELYHEARIKFNPQKVIQDVSRLQFLPVFVQQLLAIVDFLQHLITLATFNLQESNGELSNRMKHFVKTPRSSITLRIFTYIQKINILFLLLLCTGGRLGLLHRSGASSRASSRASSHSRGGGAL